MFTDLCLEPLPLHAKLYRKPELFSVYGLHIATVQCDR